MQQRLHLRITGIVQGVFYRASTRDKARRLGLTGWVRNVPDGSVEVVAEGSRDRLQQLMEWCRQGPPGAHVRAVEPSWSEASGEFDSFGVSY